jgi:hypothetical protein
MGRGPALLSGAPELSPRRAMPSSPQKSPICQAPLPASPGPKSDP